jgi:CheY-like chemotaxis protein/HPt (histidine-containing phosphotransfer) domain-containing protein
LGLTISKRLAQMLGGDITVRSTEGHGSIFSVEIDPGSLDGVRMLSEYREAVTPPSGASRPLTAGLRGKILLVEDGPDNRQLLSYYLSKAGAEVTTAENGKVGCEKALAALDSGNPFDLIVMDMQMPELDGYGATSKLRTKGYTAPIIALTAHAMADDRARCIRAGCSDYITKPVDRADLLAMVAKHLAAVPIAPPPPPAASASVASGPIRSSLSAEPELQQFLGSFVGHLPEVAGRLRALVEQRSLHQLREALHQLKGTAGLFGFPQVTDAAEAAQTHMDRGQSLDEITREVQFLVQLIRQVEGYDVTREQNAGDSAKPMTPGR